MHADRLLKLAEVLDNVPVEKFDFGSWGKFNSKGNFDLSCGSTACAIGWASTIPEFQELGLKICYANNSGVRVPAYFRTALWRPLFQGRVDFDAVAELFDISPGDAWILFAPASDNYESEDGFLSEDATPQQVAAHIRAYVNNNSTSR